MGRARLSAREYANSARLRTWSIEFPPCLTLQLQGFDSYFSTQYRNACGLASSYTWWCATDFVQQHHESCRVPCHVPEALKMCSSGLLKPRSLGVSNGYHLVRTEARTCNVSRTIMKYNSYGWNISHLLYYTLRSLRNCSRQKSNTLSKQVMNFFSQQVQMKIDDNHCLTYLCKIHVFPIKPCETLGNPHEPQHNPLYL